MFLGEKMLRQENDTLYFSVIINLIKHFFTIQKPTETNVICMMYKILDYWRKIFYDCWSLPSTR